jgi:hypothetical protein
LKSQETRRTEEDKDNPNCISIVKIIGDATTVDLENNSGCLV